MCDQHFLLDMNFLGTPQLRAGVDVSFFFKVSFLKHPKEHTYPYLVPLFNYLAMKLGEKGMKKLMKEEQAKTEQELEQKYMARIRGWESGEHIVSVGDGGEAQWFVTLLAMGPCSPLISTSPIAIKEQDKERGPFRGVEEEVHN